MKFRTKPIEIEAIKWTGDNYEELTNTFGFIGMYPPSKISPGGLVLTTADGNHVVCEPGSWVIPDNKPDTYYPCNDEHFQMKYEKVE